MHNHPTPKFSIITVTYNAGQVLEDTIQSVISQTYRHVEYIIVDGASTDGSLAVIRNYESRIARIISDPDNGMYEAINKGIKVATGDIVGLLHSDDFFINPYIVSEIADMFSRTDADVVYGNGLYVDTEHTDKVIRNWVSGNYRHWKVRFGWLPLHPTVYIKRSVIEKYGMYDESYKIASDSDFLVRYLWETDLHIEYLNRYILKMRMGGLSTDSQKRKLMWNEDVRMYRSHGFFGIPEKLMKMCWKVPQFIDAKLKRKFSDD